MLILLYTKVGAQYDELTIDIGQTKSDNICDRQHWQYAVA